MITKKLSQIGGFLKENARILCIIISVIGMICIGIFLLIKLWPLLKVMLGIAALGIVCGGLVRK